MEYLSVSSSTINAVGYDEASNTLGVRFHNGTEYHYFGVPHELFEGLRLAPSVGQSFDQNIKKGGYGYARIA
jgi:hypothetical protein